MPIWLRNYTFYKIKEFYDKEKENSEPPENLPKRGPAIKQPTYSTKAPK